VILVCGDTGCVMLLVIATKQVSDERRIHPVLSSLFFCSLNSSAL